jgi:hypothetical protein
MRAWWFVPLAIASCHHPATTERDRKERAETVGDPTIRDQTAVETNPVTLTWPGTVKTSTGKAPAVGTPCIMATTLKSTNADEISHDAWTVSCGGKKLYDEADEVRGTSHTDYVITEHTTFGEPSTFGYSLKASDVGTRAGARSQITVSTTDHELIVYRETAPTFRVVIDVVAMTGTRHGKPLFEDDIPPFPNVIHEKATLTSSTGVLPWKSKTCDLAVSPGWKTYSCYVHIACDAPSLAFGGSSGNGAESCAMKNGRPATVADVEPTGKDGDPRLSFDLDAKTMTLGDDNDDGTTYSASFKLE